MTSQIHRRSWVDRVQHIAEGFPLAPLGLFVVRAAIVLLILHGSQWVSGNTQKYLFTLPLIWTAIWTHSCLA